MNEQNDNPPIDPEALEQIKAVQDDPEFTAMLLGELAEAQHTDLTRMLAAAHDDNEYCAELQGVVKELNKAMRAEMGLGLNDDHLTAIEKELASFEPHRHNAHWYFKLELWLPLSAAIGFGLAVVVLWALDMIRW